MLRYGALPLKLDVVSVDAVSPLLGADQLARRPARRPARPRAGGRLLLLLLPRPRPGGRHVAGGRGIAHLLVGRPARPRAGAHADPRRHRRTDRRRSGSPRTPSSCTSSASATRSGRAGGCARRSRAAGPAPGGRSLPPTPISLLAAVVLYALSVGNVRGFAYMLGLSTVIDIVVVFLFTKPVVTLLARTRFFGERPSAVRAESGPAGCPPGTLAVQPAGPASRRRRRGPFVSGRGGLSVSRIGTLGHQMYTGELSYDFVGRWRRGIVISAVIILVALGGVALRGLNFSIEFRGGVDMQVPGPGCRRQGAAGHRRRRRDRHPGCRGPGRDSDRRQQGSAYRRRR